MEQKEFYVVYEVVGFKAIHEAGPYKFEWEAEDHKRDIAGFEGVYNCAVVDREKTA